jgi:glycosyltransferase involved in cell wall biosynthesis
VPSSIAIVVPVYNRPEQVVRAIESVRPQLDGRAVVVIVDDGSTDETPRVLERYAADPAFRLLRHPRNRGVAAAKNTGLDNVPPGTDLVGILDSDDTLLPGALDALAAVFEAEDGGRFSQAFGWCRDLRTGRETGTMAHREGPVTFDDALAGRFSGEFWQLARLDLIGERRFDERARGGESAVWWPLLREAPAWLIPATVRVYDTGGSDRVSRLRYDPAGARGTMWVYRAGLDAYGDDLRRRHPAMFAAQANEGAKWAALAGEARVARRAARDAWRTRRSRRGALLLLLTLLPGPAVRAVARTWARLQGR